MPFRPEMQIGYFQIISKLGSGGMGEVYRVRDTKLGRDVALKVLPDIFSGDGERMSRFRREAHVIGISQSSQYRSDIRR